MAHKKHHHSCRETRCVRIIFASFMSSNQWSSWNYVSVIFLVCFFLISSLLLFSFAVVWFFQLWPSILPCVLETECKQQMSRLSWAVHTRCEYKSECARSEEDLEHESAVWASWGRVWRGAWDRHGGAQSHPASCSVWPWHCAMHLARLSWAVPASFARCTHEGAVWSSQGRMWSVQAAYDTFCAGCTQQPQWVWMCKHDALFIWLHDRRSTKWEQNKYQRVSASSISKSKTRQFGFLKSHLFLCFLFEYNDMIRCLYLCFLCRRVPFACLRSGMRAHLAACYMRPGRCSLCDVSMPHILIDSHNQDPKALALHVSVLQKQLQLEVAKKEVRAKMRRHSYKENTWFSINTVPPLNVCRCSKSIATSTFKCSFVCFSPSV